jgi:hypothetical protein
MDNEMSRQRQMGVVLSDEIHAGLELNARLHGCSIGEEIRRRILLTLQEDVIEPHLKNFMAEVGWLAILTEQLTKQDWRTHPAANAVLRYAINALLAREKESGAETFAHGELPTKRLVAASSDDPQTMGVALEARLRVLTEPGERDVMGLLARTQWADYLKLAKKLEESKSDGSTKNYFKLAKKLKESKRDGT